MSVEEDASRRFDATGRLRETARLSGLPDHRFFASFTPRKRRETTYRLQAEADGLEIDVRVRGSGAMTARVRMPCVMVDEGTVATSCEWHPLAWASSGEEAVLATDLGHRHLEEAPRADVVLDAFLAAISPRMNVVGSNGRVRWRMAMQLLANRIARERGVRIEVVAIPPLPSARGHDEERAEETMVEVADITDPDAPVAVRGYDEDFRAIDEEMTPEAVSLMLLPPGLLVMRKRRVIFHA